MPSTVGTAHHGYSFLSFFARSAFSVRGALAISILLMLVRTAYALHPRLYAYFVRASTATIEIDASS